MENFRSVLLPLSLLLLLSSIDAELRFCHNGPHRVHDNQCPGGILFKEKIKPKCMFHASDGGSRNVAPTYNQEVCVGDGPDGTITSEPEKGGNIEIQRINMPRAPAGPKGDLTTDDCLTECLADVILPPQHEHFDEDLPVRNQTEETLVSEALFDYLTEGQDDNKDAKLNIEKIFREVFLIGQRHCGQPWVSPRFREQVESAMKFFRSSPINSPGTMDVNLHEYETIIQILQKCKADEKTVFRPMGTHCASKARINYIEVEDKDKMSFKKTYVLEPKSFRWGKFDPFIEAAWANIDFVRNFCFTHFLPRINHLHLFEQYMETLFTDLVRRRWANPPVFKRGDHYWNVLAQVQDLNTTMRNLDFCAQAALFYTPFKYQLDRPFATPVNDDIEGQTITGWPDTIESYWESYQSRGGFEAVVSRFGICAKSRKEAAWFPQTIGVKCEPVVRPRVASPDMGELPPVDR